MGKITVELIRKRAEHNEGMLANLEELALHQQHIEKIETLHKVCRHLRILLLQNNLIHKIGNLHRLKELQYLNLAINNISKVQNLQRCESLTKLDLTMNFVPKEGLLTVTSLNCNVHLEELYLLGNPCSDWHGYRQYVIATLPRLKKLDGKDIKPSERIAANQALVHLHASLCAELRADGIDVEEAATAEDDGLEYDSDAEIEDPGYVDTDGEFKRPWCPATRIIEHRENERIEREQNEKKKSSSSSLFAKTGKEQPRWETFPEIDEASGRVFQKNEGQWEYTLDESEDRQAIVLDVAVGKYLDTSLIQADVRPLYARLLVKGRLLQLRLPCEVKPDSASAQRSKITGSLLLTMPKERPEDENVDISLIRKSNGSSDDSKRGLGCKAEDQAPRMSAHAKLLTDNNRVSINNIVKKGPSNTFTLKEIRKAELVVADEDDIPPL